MSKTERDESETLNDPKAKLWIKMQILDARLSAIDEKSDGLPQSKIAKKLDTNRMEVSRLIERLQARGYITRKRGKGVEKIVRLNL